jgi:hypothetical protein
MLHGRFDEGATLRTAAEPLFQLLPESKRMVIFKFGHIPAMKMWVPVARKWFDKTMGPVSGP